MKVLGIIALSVLVLFNPLNARDCKNVCPRECRKECKEPLNSYFKEFPWMGLIANKISYGPITLSDVDLQDGHRLAVVGPGETVHGSLHYSVRAEDLDLLHRYHLVVGLKGQGAQDCVTHNYGLWNSRGEGTFTIKAPKKPGVYEVRFILSEGITCEKARDEWNLGHETPTSSATIGVLIVEA